MDYTSLWPSYVIVQYLDQVEMDPYEVLGIQSFFIVFRFSMWYQYPLFHEKIVNE